MSRSYILRFKTFKVFRPVQSREGSVLQAIESAFPSGDWVEVEDGGAGTVLALGASQDMPAAPDGVTGGVGQEMISPEAKPDSRGAPAPSNPLTPPPGAELPNGTPADPDDPKLKHAVQRTGMPAVLFTRKADASKFAADLVRASKQRGAEVAGNATTGWRVFPKVGEPWGMTIVSKTKEGK